MRRLAVPAVLGVAHGAADAAAGLLLGSLLRSLALPQAGALVLLYNALAFSGQPVAGILVDRSRRPKIATVGGLLLLAVALVASEWKQPVAVVIAALGSAFFHVGGGALAICATRDRATGPGFFAAPGVAGLAIGGTLAVTDHVVIWPLVAMLLISSGAISSFGTRSGPDSDAMDEQALAGVDAVILLLLAAIALRSAVWNSFQIVFEGQIKSLVLVAVAACLGKMAGGILADRVGLRRWCVSALAGATLFLAFSAQHFSALLAGVALLQSATPVVLVAAARLMPRRPATASGLVLGLGVAIGGVPAYSGLLPAVIAPAAAGLMTMGALLALWQALSARAFPFPPRRTCQQDIGGSRARQREMNRAHEDSFAPPG